jgi:hypothetical protein
MSSQRQIDANRQNAQNSCGPTTPEGKQRSSRNAVKHGFTGQSLILSPEEADLYKAFVQDYFDDYAPHDAATKQLTQQLADAHWSLQQIFVQQSNVMTLINAATDQLSQAADPIAALTTLGPLTKTLQTYTIYEQRRRRAADAIETKLTTLLQERAEQVKQQVPQAAKLAKLHIAQGKSFDPADFGFVCSAEQVAQFLKGEALARACANPATQPEFTPQPMTREDIRKFAAECEALEKQSPK